MLKGTLLNCGAILAGSLAGYYFGRFLTRRYQETLNTVLGVFTLGLGIQFFLQAKDFFPVLVLSLLGAFIGETLKIDAQLEKLFKRAGGGFTTASLMFCVGSMAILGAMEEGVTGNIEILTIKSMLDGFTAMVLTVSMGISVLFSALSVLVYQGSISLLAQHLSFLKAGTGLSTVNGVGGICLFMLGLNFLEIKKSRTANMIPALLLAFVWAWAKASFDF